MLKFRDQLLITLLLVGSLPAVLISYETFNHNSEQVKDFSIDLAVSKLHNIATGLSNEFKEAERYVTLYARHPSLQAMQYEKFIPLLKSELSRLKPKYEKFIIGKPNGHFFNTSGANILQGGIRTFDDSSATAKPKSIHKRDYWQATIPNNSQAVPLSYISNPMISYTTGVKQVVIASSILNKQQELVGMVGLSIGWKRIDEIINNLVDKSFADSPEKAKIMLVSGDGTYWYHWQSDKVIQLAKDGDGNILLNKEGEKAALKFNILKEKNEALTAIGREMVLGQPGIKLFDIEGRRQHIIYQPIEGSSYAIALTIDDEIIMTPVYEALKHYLGILGLSLILIMLIGIAIARYFSSPIAELIHKLTSLAQGKKTEKTIRSKTKELQTLSQAIFNLYDKINLQTKNLKVHENEVMELNKVLETKVKQRTEELEKTLTIAEEANKSKSIFLSNMSHEIRTPMNGIIGLTELCLGTELNQQQQNYLNKVMISSKTLMKIINEILDFNKIESNKIELEETSVELIQVAREAESLMLPAASEKGIEFKFELAHSLPKHVITDPFRLTQIILNLCGNAIKFTHEGSVTLEIFPVKSTLCNHTETRIRFAVTDTGVGIKNSKDLFTPFKQEDASTTRKFGGTGLGLTISKRLVDLMGGTLVLESEHGKGTCFSFDLTLPVAPETEFNKPLATNMAPTPQTDVAQNSQASILVVEDNKINQLIAEDMLKKSGYQITIVENGQQAIDTIKEKHFDLVLMDIQMPIMDGETATRLLKSDPNYKHIPIIAMTANVMTHETDNYLKIGFSDFIGKPFILEDILKIINKVLSK